MAQLIVPNDRPAALVGAHEIYLAPHIAELLLARPVRRYVAAKAVYALDVAEGLRPGHTATARLTGGRGASWPICARPAAAGAGGCRSP
jgi:hypothetical protein